MYVPFFDDKEQLTLYKKSNKKWLSKQMDTKYDHQKHRTWVSNHNKGVSHMGIHPTLLPRSSIRCDIFHMGCAIGRRLIQYLQTFSLRQDRPFQAKIFSLLETFWSPGVLCLWRIGKSFTSLLGIEIKAFVLQCPAIASIIDNNLIHSIEGMAFSKSLKLWYDIEKFLKKADIKDTELEAYPSQLDLFELNIKSFYKLGGKSFMSKLEEGDDETYYLHALRYYIPHFSRDTWKVHKCGIGVFTMQGYERRNKESKNIMRKFSNNKNNILDQILKRLYDNFAHGDSE